MCLARRRIPNGPITSTVSTPLSVYDLARFLYIYIANSILFTKAQRNAVIMSNIGIALMVWGVSYSSSVWGASEVIKYYAIPWLEVTHWCKP